MATVTAPALTSSDTHLQYLIKNTQACVLRPLCFFVSWQGVLTLAYRGFPLPLVQLKQAIGDYYGSLPAENSGSRWPKSSLGALKDRARLTPEQLARLNELCRQASGIFQAPGSPKAQSVLVDKLAVVVYECRCLERQIAKHEVALAEPVDAADAPPAELARVEGIVAEADDPDYWFHASRDGSREAHYRSRALGVTLVHEIAPFRGAASPGPSAAHSSAAAPGSGGGASPPGTPHTWGAALPGIVAAFRDKVDTEFPGLYSWFDDNSLHITVRAIIS